MSLGCYIISTKEILINKEAVKDKTRHISPVKDFSYTFLDLHLYYVVQIC